MTTARHRNAYRDFYDSLGTTPPPPPKTGPRFGPAWRRLPPPRPNGACFGPAWRRLPPLGPCWHGPGPGPGPPPLRAAGPPVPAAPAPLRLLGARRYASGPSAPCASASALRPWPPGGGPWRRPAVAPGLRLPPAAAPPRRGGPRPGLLARPIGACRGPPLRRRPRPPSASLRLRLRAPAARCPGPRPGRCGRPCLLRVGLRPALRCLRAPCVPLGGAGRWGPPGRPLPPPALPRPSVGWRPGRASGSGAPARASGGASPRFFRPSGPGVGVWGVPRLRAREFRRLRAAGAGTTWIPGRPGVCVWFGPGCRGAWAAVPFALCPREWGDISRQYQDVGG